jgi:Flp pilus assembly protein TadD
MASTQASSSIARLRAFAAVAVVAFATSGCLKRSPAEVTGSIDAGGPASAEAYRRQAEAMAARHEANPADPKVALAYARALRGSDQRAQAVAVLQQAAIRSPSNLEILAAYGKALADVGRYKEAAEVLGRAHLPERPDWRILSAQGAVADQTGDHVQAQSYYEAALRIVPGEPGVLSNFGLSYALSKRLPDAERVLRQAAAHGSADARVRQNLALVLGLQGKFGEAEEVLKRDLSPAETEANLSAMRSLVSQPNSWKALQRAEASKKAAQKPKN